MANYICIFHYISQGWNEVKDVLTDPNLLMSLANAALISSSASPQTARTTQATQYIETYIAAINTTINANPDQAFTLEQDLNTGLMTVKLLTKCYNNRIGFGTYVSKMCQKGSDSLENLYNQGAKIYKVWQHLSCINIVVIFSGAEGE